MVSIREPTEGLLTLEVILKLIDQRALKLTIKIRAKTNAQTATLKMRRRT